ncbi:homeodomain leucin zipper protein [Klebsormidium nitens]|uniref:Homeodomain leucin zipper protein n=1 Tax=Klebsormidium nitens TaxID=105231 RepID=A0A1Y1IAQ8_KLENI|nr:homeodomain leucin zipper protein [Klebsormidium nitens]|eukprot:GAQ85188.1 homeodomain leucin zipper protein [Klebsormidium nitens]
MLLSEENERLRAELDRMKSLAASLLGVPAVREPQAEPVGLGRQPSGNQLMPSAQEPSNSFQLSLSQPTVSDFVGLRSSTSSFNSSSPATVSLGAFPTLSRAGSGLHGGDFFPQGMQATTSQMNGVIDFPVFLTGGGRPQRQQPVLGSSAYSLENLQAFAGDIRSSPVQKTQAMLPLLPVGSSGGGLPQPAIAPPAKKDETFIYPGISHIEKKLSDHLKPFSSHLGVHFPPAPIPTAQLAAKEDPPHEGGAQGYASQPRDREAGKQGYAAQPAAEEKDDNEEPKQRSGRKRDRDSSEENRKMRLSKEQSQQLEAAFNEQSTHSPKQKNALALRLGLRPRQVEVWFQNRRARTKLKQTEIDCEVLKRCCETLTEENRRLQKEVIALKSRPPASSGDDRREFGAEAPVCVKCKETLSNAEASALHIQLTEGGLVFDKQESGLDSEQHTVSVS